MTNRRTPEEIAYANTNAAHRRELRTLHALDLFGASDETMADQRAVVADLDAKLNAHESVLAAASDR